AESNVPAVCVEQNRAQDPEPVRPPKRLNYLPSPAVVNPQPVLRFWPDAESGQSLSVRAERRRHETLTRLDVTQRYRTVQEHVVFVSRSHIVNRYTPERLVYGDLAVCARDIQCPVHVRRRQLPAVRVKRYPRYGKKPAACPAQGPDLGVASGVPNFYH